MKANTALLASVCVLKRQRSSSSHSRVAKKLSHIALSYASPTEPIEGRTPASRQRWPNAIEVYCLGSNARRNTLKEKSRSRGAGGVRIGLVGRHCSHRVARRRQDEISSGGSGLGLRQV